MFVEVVRLFIVVLATAAGFWVSREFGSDPGSEVAGAAGMVGCLVGYVGGGMVGRLLERAIGVVERRADRLPAPEVVAGALGAVCGGIGGVAIGVPFALLLPPWMGFALAGLAIWFGLWAGFHVVSRQSVAFLEMIGLSTRPLVRAQAYDARDGMLVDTSVVMDGQLLPLTRAGLVGSDLLVARFVLDELQGFADGADGTKARRARRGLEALDLLRRHGPVRVFVVDDEVPEHQHVDAKLAALAKRLQLRLLTNDAALARVAEVQGVPTCNLRRLASDLSPDVVPGEQVRVQLTRPGREPGQGVGHLDDGSMVVVNGGADLVGGPPVALRVASVVPTAVGRILFATVDEDASRGDGRGADVDAADARRPAEQAEQASSGR